MVPNRWLLRLYGCPFFPFLQTVFVRSLFRSVRLSIFQLKNSCEFLHKFMFDVWLKLNPRFLEFTWFAMQLFFSRSLCWNYIGIHFIICPFSSSNGIIGIFLLNISLTFQLCMLLWNFITQLKLHLWIANWMYSSLFFCFFFLSHLYHILKPFSAPLKLYSHCASYLGNHAFINRKEISFFLSFLNVSGPLTYKSEFVNWWILRFSFEGFVFYHSQS